MCCGTEIRHGMQSRGPHRACFCGCDEPWNYRPRLLTREEKIARLKNHLEVLKEEAKAIEEQIGLLNKEN